MPVVLLNQAFVDNMKAVPGQKHTEYCDQKVRGLFADVLPSAASKPTWNYRYKDARGKTKTRRLGLVSEITLDDARKQATLLKAETAIGKMPATVDEAGGISLDKFMLGHYLPYARDHKRSHGRDEQLYRLRIAARFGHLPLSEIKRRDVQMFHRELSHQGLSKASANHHAQLLRHVLNVAVEWEMLDRNVLAGMKLFVLDNQVNNPMDDEDLARFVNVLKTDENRTVCLILAFLLNTGARLGEALSLKWKDVELSSPAKWTVLAENAKSKKAKTFPLNADAVWTLQQVDRGAGSDYVFPSPVTGKPYTTITRAWYRIRGVAKLDENLRIHDLRHGFATRMLDRGRNLWDVQMLLGHADPRTSLRYAHPSMKVMSEAANAASVAMSAS